jgi:tetratricopeptide (TPR) repeat protein
MTDLPQSQRASSRLDDCFRRGEQRAAAHDFDYAHAMFTECVVNDPGNLQYVEAMLANLQERYGKRKKRPGGRLARPLRTAVEGQQWDEILRLGIATLERNPWHVATLHVLARACEALHFNEVELAYLKAALDADPRAPDVNRHCAKSLARMGQFDQAIACWHRVERYVPGDQEAVEMIARLAEEKIRWAGVSVAKDEPTGPAVQPGGAAASDPDGGRSTAGPQESDLPRIAMTPRQELETAIADNPADVGGYLSLVALLVEQGEFDGAERWLERAERNCAQRSTVQRARESLEAERAEAIAAAERDRRDAGEQKPSRGFPWLEVLLVAALAGLLVQLIPGWQSGVKEFGERHLRAILIALNIAIIVALIWWNQRSKSF